MTSEQPELLFFDTFSHETSESRQEQNDVIVGTTRNMRENIDHLPVESQLINETIKDSSCFGTVLLELAEESLSPPNANKLISLDNEDEKNVDSEDTIKSDYNLCEPNIENIKETTKTFEHKRDLWIPSYETERALSMKLHYSQFPNRDLLTSPKIFEEKVISGFHQLTATISEMGMSCVDSQMQNVSQDEQGIVELVQKGAYNSAVNLTSRLLMVRETCFRKNGLVCHTPQSIQLWFSRLALLVKLQEFDLADIEARCWGDCDKPDLYYQFYPDIYNGRSGSLIPFQMRLLVANLPSYCGRHSETLKRLFAILATVRKIIRHLENETASHPELECNNLITAKRLWDEREKRVIISIVNVALKMKDYILAVELVNGLIKEETTVIKKHTLYSILGRIHLQFGDLTNAEKLFAISLCDNGNSEPQRDFQNIVDLGLLAVARNDFYEAYRCFEKASFVVPSSAMVMNNCAMCLFYLGHLSESIRLLSGAVNNDPLHALQDSLVLNLCTMHELSTARSRDNKIHLLKLTTLFKEDSINVSSFRLF